MVLIVFIELISFGFPIKSQVPENLKSASLRMRISSCALKTKRPFFNKGLNDSSYASFSEGEKASIMDKIMFLYQSMIDCINAPNFAKMSSMIFSPF